MKRLLPGIAIVFVVAAIAAGLLRYLSPDQVARRTIERFGSEAIQASVRVDRVQISPADGSGLISGLSVSNPAGFKTPTAITAALIKMTVEVSSLDRDPVIIRTLSVASPRITYEPGQSGSNFTALLQNIERRAGASEAGKPGRKLVIDRVLFYDVELNYASASAAGQTINKVDLPDIRMSGIGRVQGGVTDAELARAIVETLLYQSKRAIPSGAVQSGPQNPPRK